MKTVRSLILLAGILFILQSRLPKADARDPFIGCPLVWEERNFGDEVPETAIPSALYGQNNYVARALTEEDKFIVGRLDNGKVYSNDRDQVLNHTHYEVLTNPHGCILQWAPASDFSHNVPTADNQSSTRVGRTVVEDILVCGQANATSISVVSDSGEAEQSDQFDVLKSYSRGLILSLTNFQFDQDPFRGNPEMLGLDEIINKSPATVAQSVVHKKRIFESSSLTTEESSWGHTWEIKLSMNTGFISEFVKEYQLDPTVSETELTDSTEALIESYREISVPPHTSAVVCTVVNVNENFYAQYSSEGRYSAPGLSGVEVAAILAPDGIRGVLDGDSVVVITHGSFSGTLAVSTEFISTSNSYIEGGGCYEVAEKIQSLKRDKAFGRLTDENDYQKRVRFINDLIRNSSKSISNNT